MSNTETPTSLRLQTALLDRADALTHDLALLPEGAALARVTRADVLRAALALGLASLERRVAEAKEGVR